MSLERLPLLIDSEKNIFFPALVFGRITTTALVRQIYGLMEPEFLSRGGNLTDIGLDTFTHLALMDGEVWAACDDDTVLGSLSLTPIPGENESWWYLNHGVLVPWLRHQGGEVMGKLVRTMLENRPVPARYVVLTVAKSHLLRAGFSLVTLGEFAEFDAKVAGVLAGKLRPQLPTHICVCVREAD